MIPPQKKIGTVFFSQQKTWLIESSEGKHASRKTSEIMFCQRPTLNLKNLELPNFKIELPLAPEETISFCVHASKNGVHVIFIVFFNFSQHLAGRHPGRSCFRPPEV